MRVTSALVRMTYILTVAKSDLMRNYIVNALGEKFPGSEVVGVGTGEAALKTLAESARNGKNISAIVTELVMSERLTGIGFLEELVRKSQGIPVIVIGGSQGTNWYGPKVKEMGAKTYLDKTDFGGIITAVESAIGNN